MLLSPLLLISSCISYLLHTNHVTNITHHTLRSLKRALYYWNSEHLCVNVLSQSRANIFLPYVFGPLSKNAQGHWNQTVEGLAQSVLKMVRTYMYTCAGACMCSVTCYRWMVQSQYCLSVYSSAWCVVPKCVKSHHYLQLPLTWLHDIPCLP